MMESIEETLANLVNTVPGATIAALLGMDGVGVQMALGDAWQDAEQDTIEIELAALAEAIQKAARQLQAGPSPEFFLSTAHVNFLGAMVDPAYFLVLGLEPNGDLERAGESLGEAREALAG
jgi:predicted regulator of Ras-like GTPase activity (Roadblock/LC7/MglB family)